MVRVITRLVSGSAETLAELEACMAGRAGLRVVREELVLLTIEGGKVSLLSVSGAARAIARALEAFYRHRKKKFRFQMAPDGSLDVAAENYTAEELTRLIGKAREIREERRQKPATRPSRPRAP